MKKLLLIPVVLFILFTKVFAQDCKWEENKKDPISGSKYVKSKLSKIVVGEKPAKSVAVFFTSHIELKDGKVTLFVQYEITSILSLEKIQFPEIIIKLADGTKIDDTSTEQFSTRYDPNFQGTASDLKWTISNDNVKKIAASKITAIKISFAGQDYSFIFEDKRAEEFLTMFSCMSKEL